MVNVFCSGSYVVLMENVAPVNSVKKVATIGTFGVTSTDSKGDVFFRIRGVKQSVYCVNALFYWLGQSNPNLWLNWEITELASPPWKTWKVFVPKTQRAYFLAVYGYSISNALFLVTNY